MSQCLEQQEAVDPPVEHHDGDAYFFGAAGSELFAWLHRRTDASTAPLGAVLCGTFGAESLSTHRALRTLAVSLAAHGIPALRFDYTGTGNSVRSPGTPLRLSTYVDNVSTAIRALKAHGPVDRVVLVGVRLGALLAMKTAAQEDVSGVVVWGPVVSGRRFAREWRLLAQYAERAGEARLPDDDAVHAAGFSLGREFLEELSACSLLHARPLGSPACLVVERDELTPEDQLIDALRRWQLRTERCRPNGFIAGMLAEPHLTEIPSAAIRAVREWIEGTARKSAAIVPMPATMAPRSSDTIVIGGGVAGSIRIRERFLDRNDSDGVFGVISEPADPADWNRQCIVILNAGSVHHIGPNRMHVEFARLLAAEGSRVCRADLRGLGDSRVRSGGRGNDPYPAGAVDDVAGILRALSATGEHSRLALVGLCSGAWASFQSALRLEGITDVILINPDFYGERSVVGKPPSFVRPKDYSHYKQSARSWLKWRKLLSGQANVRRILRVLANRAVFTAGSLRRKLAGDRHQLDEDLTRLASDGVRVGLIFSPGDGGADFLMANGRVGLQHLRRSNLLRQTTISDSDHPFSVPGASQRLAATLSEWLRPRQ